MRVRLLLDYLEEHPGVGGGQLHPWTRWGSACHLLPLPSVASELEGAARTGPISRLLAKRRVTIGVPDVSGPVDWLAGASMMPPGRGGADRRHLRRDLLSVFRRPIFAVVRPRQEWPTHFVRESRVEHIGSVSTGMKDLEAGAGLLVRRSLALLSGSQAALRWRSGPRWRIWRAG